MRGGKKRYTVEQVRQALIDTNGFLTFAAKKLGCDYHTVANYIKSFPTLKKTQDELKEHFNDIGENCLLQEITNGNIDVIKHWLRFKGKDRGWGGEKDSQEGSSPQYVFTPLLTTDEERDLADELTKRINERQNAGNS
jgi:hypothetical protein